MLKPTKMERKESTVTMECMDCYVKCAIEKDKMDNGQGYARTMSPATAQMYMSMSAEDYCKTEGCAAECN